MDTSHKVDGNTAFECALKAIDRAISRARVAAKVAVTLDGKVKGHALVKKLDVIRHDMRVLIFDCEDAERLGMCDCDNNDHETVCFRCGVGIRGI